MFVRRLVLLELHLKETILSFISPYGERLVLISPTTGEIDWTISGMLVSIPNAIGPSPGSISDNWLLSNFCNWFILIITSHNIK
ncbi:hypothetical protein MS53_0552 [Mycoplasmopsis synoviae 53]|uniref:Uncharacterized protein n=1 Tax=Mycoplasmopsis synoviae (strain 53) TaxID=262723 RepID=Q4A5L1_MYCS5|nr:hypothetical protein MS53_0552 [Mycoplasmopsis synoviae 53]